MPCLCPAYTLLMPCLWPAYALPIGGELQMQTLRHSCLTQRLEQVQWSLVELSSFSLVHMAWKSIFVEVT